MNSSFPRGSRKKKNSMPHLQITSINKHPGVTLSGWSEESFALAQMKEKMSVINEQHVRCLNGYGIVMIESPTC